MVSLLIRTANGCQILKMFHFHFIWLGLIRINSTENHLSSVAYTFGYTTYWKCSCYGFVRFGMCLAVEIVEEAQRQAKNANDKLKFHCTILFDPER